MDECWDGFLEYSWINPINNTQNVDKSFSITNNENNELLASHYEKCYPRESRSENFVKELSTTTNRRILLKMCSLKLLATCFSILYLPSVVDLWAYIAMNETQVSSIVLGK